MLGRSRFKADDKSCDKAIIKISEGDKEALSVIYNAYGKLIYATAYQICRNSHTAQDILQDVLVTVAEKAKSYKHGTNPRAWIMAITRNLTVNRQKLHDNSKTDDLLDESVRAAHYDDTDTKLMIEEALATLSEDDRFILYGKLYAGLDHTEIGNALGISRAASSARYNRALKKLKEYFL